MRTEQEIQEKVIELKRASRMMTNLFPDQADGHDGFIRGLEWVITSPDTEEVCRRG